MASWLLASTQEHVAKQQLTDWTYLKIFTQPSCIILISSVPFLILNNKKFTLDLDYDPLASRPNQPARLRSACDRIRYTALQYLRLSGPPSSTTSLLCWTWNVSGWVFQLGGLDFVGGTPVHLASGSAVLAYSLMLTKKQPHLAYSKQVIFDGTTIFGYWKVKRPQSYLSLTGPFLISHFLLFLKPLPPLHKSYFLQLPPVQNFLLIKILLSSTPLLRILSCFNNSLLWSFS